MKTQLNKFISSGKLDDLQPFFRGVHINLNAQHLDYLKTPKHINALKIICRLCLKTNDILKNGNLHLLERGVNQTVTLSLQKCACVLSLAFLNLWYPHYQRFCFRNWFKPEKPTNKEKIICILNYFLKFDEKNDFDKKNHVVEFIRNYAD